MKFEDYSDFCRYISDEEEPKFLFGTEDWSVIQLSDQSYWYYKHEMEGSSDEFCELYVIATAQYTLQQVPDYEKLEKVFVHDIAGEYVNGYDVYFYWFIEKGEQRDAKSNNILW